MICIYIIGLIFPWICYISDLLGNNFDAAFSVNTLNKLRVKDNSFLRKIIPIKEGKIIKNGQVRGYRYYLYPRVLALFIQTIFILIGLSMLIVHFAVVHFMTDMVFCVLGGVLIGIWIFYTLIINIASQGLHL